MPCKTVRNRTVPCKPGQSRPGQSRPVPCYRHPWQRQQQRQQREWRTKMSNIQNVRFNSFLPERHSAIGNYDKFYLHVGRDVSLSRQLKN